MIQQPFTRDNMCSVHHKARRIRSGHFEHSKIWLNNFRFGVTQQSFMFRCEYSKSLQYCGWSVLMPGYSLCITLSQLHTTGSPAKHCYSYGLGIPHSTEPELQVSSLNLLKISADEMYLFIPRDHTGFVLD